MNWWVLSQDFVKGPLLGFRDLAPCWFSSLAVIFGLLHRHLFFLVNIPAFCCFSVFLPCPRLLFYILSLRNLVNFALYVGLPNYMFSHDLFHGLQAQKSKRLLVIFPLCPVSASKSAFLTLQPQSSSPDLHLLLISHLRSPPSSLSPKLV